MQVNHVLSVEGLVHGASGLAVAIAEMKGASKTWFKLTHKVAASAVIHAHTTGDVRPLQAALMAMPNGGKTNSMRKYFETFAPVKWSDVSKKFKFKTERQVKGILEGADNDLLTAILGKHWSTMGPVESADNFKPLDMKNRLVRLVTDANKALEGDHKDKQTVTTEQVNKLAALIREMFPEGAAA